MLECNSCALANYRHVTSLVGMTSRLLSRHAPQFQLTLPSRPLQPVAVVSTPSPASCADADCRSALRKVVSDARRAQARFEASEIFRGLYLGSWLDADSVDELRKHNVTRVLNVAEECPISSSCEHAIAAGSIKVKKLDLRDHSDEDIAAHFAEALCFVHEGITRNEGVLVHCRQGVSRSATIVLAYLMEYGIVDDKGYPHPMTYADAFDYVKERRPFISPNLGFVLALHEVERAKL
jgi:predicted protein tyrosine phosphatase